MNELKVVIDDSGRGVVYLNGKRADTIVPSMVGGVHATCNLVIDDKRNQESGEVRDELGK